MHPSINLFETVFSIHTVLPEDYFGANKKFLFLQNAKEEVGRADIAHSIGWVRINMQPIKETIETYASKWMYTYTKYLSEQV